MQNAKPDGLAIFLLILVCASWGLQNVTIKVAAAEVPLVLQSAIRSFGATLLVLVWTQVRGQSVFKADGTLLWGLAAGLLFAGQFLMVYWGLTYTNASRAVIFLYVSPFIVAIGSHFVLKGDALNRQKTFGLLCAFAGILAAFSDSLVCPSQGMILGDMMLVVGALFWGATTVLIKASPLAKIPSSKTLLYQLGVSAPVLFLGSVLLGEPVMKPMSHVTIAALIYQIFWVGCVSYLVWFWLVQQYSAPKLTSFHFLTPLFGVIAGVTLLDEPLTPMFAVAAGLVAIGIYFVNSTPKPPLSTTDRGAENA